MKPQTTHMKVRYFTPSGAVARAWDIRDENQRTECDCRSAAAPIQVTRCRRPPGRTRTLRQIRYRSSREGVSWPAGVGSMLPDRRFDPDHDDAVRLTRFHAISP